MSASNHASPHLAVPVSSQAVANFSLPSPQFGAFSATSRVLTLEKNRDPGDRPAAPRSSHNLRRYVFSRPGDERAILRGGGRLIGAQPVCNGLAARGIEPVIPPRSNRGELAGYDREAYKRRNLTERCVNCLKQFRRIATRYEKTASAYLSMLCIAAARLWIKTVNTG